MKVSRFVNGWTLMALLLIAVIVDVKISLESATVGKTVKDLSLPRESKLAIIIPAEGSAYVPIASTVLQAGDQIIAVTTPESKEALRAALRGV